MISGHCTAPQFTGYLKQFYINTHYIVERDSWPPEQPKHFTTVVLLQHKNQPSQEHVITVEKAAAAGNISTIVSVANNHKHEDFFNNPELNHSLQQSRTTKNIIEILNVLEDPQTNPRTLLVEGAPGIGKTFLLRHVAFEWAHNRMFNSSQFLFLLCLRDPAVQAISSIRDLANFFYKKEKSAWKLVKNISEHLSSNGGKTVTFLLDGYDELPQQLQEDSFIADILNHQVLPASGVMVTSRPHATTHLHDNAACLVKILGFAEEDQAHYIEQSLHGQLEKIAKVMEYLDRQPTISSLCFIPYHLTVLMFLYKKGYRLPRNSAELYEHFICLTIRRYFSKHKVKRKITDLNSLPTPYHEIINQFAAFSFTAIGKQQITFTMEELETACPGIKEVPEGINGLGLLQAVKHFGYTDTTTTVNFLHLTIQEYLAAYYIASLPPDEELLVLHEKFFDDYYYNTFYTYMGLTKGQHKAFKHFLSGGGRYFGTGSILFSTLFNRIQKKNKICDKFLEHFDFCLYLFRCLYEAGDKCWYDEVIESRCFVDGIVVVGSSPRQSMEAISIMLTCKSEWIRLHLNPRTYFFDCYLKAFHKPLMAHCPVLNTIELCNEYWGDKVLPTPCQLMLADIVIACKTKVLKIERLVVDHPDWIEKVLQHKYLVLQELTLDNVNITSSTACKLFLVLRSSKLKTLKTLILSNNYIDDAVVPVIIPCLQEDCSLQTLYLDKNPITGNGALQILQALEFNDTLETLRFCKFSQEITVELLQVWTKIDEKRISLVKPSINIYYFGF